MKDRESSKLSRASQFSKTTRTPANRKEKTGDKCKLIGLGRTARSLEKVQQFTELNTGKKEELSYCKHRALGRSMDSENSAVQENSRSVLVQVSYNCSVPSFGCGDANRLIGSPGTG